VILLKQVELANATGMSEATISKILAGKRRPSWRVAKALAMATGTDPYLWMENNTDELKRVVKDAE
jgi:transcriptional regulator with XRE-family HTH domain